MAKFRKKPVVIDAILWNGRDDETGIGAACDFIDFDALPYAPDDPHIKTGIGFTPTDGRLMIPTLEGTMTANPGDWIIRGVAGEYYPCKPDIFAATYESETAALQAELKHEREIKKGEKKKILLQEVEKNAALEAKLTAAEQAANLLIDYCEDHDWGMMPEPFASINPLLKLLGRERGRKMVCEKCWGDAYMRHLENPEKSQSDHYQELLIERKDNPCTPEQEAGRTAAEGSAVGKGNQQIVDDPRPVRVWCIGPDQTEYFAAHDEVELRQMYVGMVGEEQTKEDFETYCEEVPQSAMDAPLDWTDEEGRRIQTTWRQVVNEADVPCQVSTGYN